MIGAILKTLLGIDAADSIVNKIGGVINHGAMLAFATWLYNNREILDARIHFETSLGFLALMAAMAYFIMEVLRRSRT